jgi:hypothetical protein
MGMRADFQKGRLVAETAGQVTDASSELPVPPPLTMPETPTETPGEVPLPLEAVKDAPRSDSRLAASLLTPPSAPPQPPAVILWEKRAPTAAPAPETQRENDGAAPHSMMSAAQQDSVDRAQGQASPRTEENQVVEYLNSVSADVSATLEKWRQSWESGRLDDYIRHYDGKAVQQGRRDAKNIRRQKESLWARIQPTLVQFSGMRIVPDKNAGQIRERNGARDRRCVVVDMNQIYADSSGHSDKGTKTLQLCPNGGEWKIHRENWIALPPDPHAEREAALPSD